MKRASLKWSRNKWVLGEDFSVLIDKKVIIVPAGFRTDLASVPRFLWVIAPPFGDYNNAAIVHDYLYRKAIFSREYSDKLFLKKMSTDGVGWFTRTVFYLAVRTFGWLSYGKET